MGTLPSYLHHAFAAACPPGWSVQPEVALLSDDLAALLGYRPQADLLLSHPDGRRIWVEFEISRADPVANHAKFASAHLFQPQADADVFLAMLSPHVARGRRTLAATAVTLLRRIGMQAFQTTLFPHLAPADIKALNATPLAQLLSHAPPVTDEIERLFAVTRPLITDTDGRIHFAGDILDVLLNLRHWQRELQDPVTRRHWGRRTVTYFVAEPRHGRFAPSKFCAYSDVAAPTPQATMTIARYGSLDGREPRFDGHRARLHLTRHLGFSEQPLAALPTALQTAFAQWLSANADTISVHPRGPIILMPPAWFR